MNGSQFIRSLFNYSIPDDETNDSGHNYENDAGKAQMKLLSFIYRNHNGRKIAILKSSQKRKDGFYLSFLSTSIMCAKKKYYDG